MTQQPGLGRALGVAQGLQGLRAQQQQFNMNQMNMQMAQEQAAQQRAAQEAAAARQAMLQQKLQGVVNPETGQLDPDGFTQLLLTDPEVAGQVRQQFGAVDEMRIDQGINRAFGLKQALDTGDPALAQQAFQQGGYADDPLFQGLADNIQSGDVQGAMNELRYGVAALGGPERYSQVFGGMEPEGRVGTYNPRDYTVESWAKFVEGGRRDASVLERYFPMRQTNIGGTTYFSDDQGNLYLPASPQVQQAAGAQQPAAPAVQATPLTPEEQTRQEAERVAQLEASRAGAQQEAASQSPEAAERRRLQEQEATRAVDLVDRLLSSERLGRISGAETGVPIVGAAQAMGARDELNDLKALANLLTMGNLGRMSGVLSESDIRLIASAASGMEIGDYGTPVSEEGLRRNLQDIRERLMEGIESRGGTAQEQNQPMTIEDADAFIDSIIGGDQ